MLPVVTAAEMARADQAAIDGLRIGGIRLMELAGMRVAACISELLETDIHDACRFLVVCGKGNNGGDGFVVARHLINLGASVDLVLLYPSSSLSVTNRDGLAVIKAYAEHTDNLRIFESAGEALPFVVETLYDALVDAVLGTGLKIDSSLEMQASPARDGIDLLRAVQTQSGAPVVSIDTPSGLDATSGFAAEPSVAADMTVTMAFLKTGFFFNEGPLLTGDIRTAEISIPEFLLDPGVCRLTDREYAAEHFSLRHPSEAKHMNGKVLIVAGSQSARSSMIGAALLSTKAALLAGAGYVCTALPGGSMDIMHVSVPEAIVTAQKMELILEKALWADAVLIGCGLGREPAAVELIRDLLVKPELRQKKLVIDADALYAIAATGLLQEGLDFSNALLTPHYGEFSRLTGIPAETITRDPLNLAREFAKKYELNILLKGHPTILACHDGRMLINDSGTEALATAGSGDVLAGMIAALAAKGAPVFDAGASAAWFHGRAGDLADEVASLVSAGGILAAIPEAIHEIFEREE